jgi:predicted CoA-binding protein
MKTIAVVGASNHRAKFGNKCVRAYRDSGWQVYPVNPTEREIEGLPAYRDLASVPRPLDSVSVYLPPPVTFDVLPAIAATGAREVWFNPGSADAGVLAEAQRLGIPSRPACSIVAIGRRPSEFPD